MKRFTSETLVAVVILTSFGYQTTLAVDLDQLACSEDCLAPDCACDEARCASDPAASCACSAGACAGKPLCYTVRFVTGDEAAALGFDADDEVAVRSLCTQNLRPAGILSRLDIDDDGVADNSPDSDGDGLPDNWEDGGLEALSADGSQTDRVVFYPAPTAIVPGTPPTPIFTRLAVTTSALDPDTDGDGLSDFVEVFGLKFIDENGDGILQSSGGVNRGREWVEDSTCGQLPVGRGTPQAELDAESGTPGDGLPSPGDCPRDNSEFANGFGRVNPDVDAGAEFELRHDFDGLVFTDPVNADTDGDGDNDKIDNDPLINPRAFGESGNIIVKFNVEGIDDFDQDGLGNGMDMGNDLLAADFGVGAAGARDFQEIDNPTNVIDLLELFRRDLIFDENDVAIPNPTVPEAQIEDLLGVDWDGNGLWRTTDVRTWHLVIADSLISRAQCYPLLIDIAETPDDERERAANPTCPPEELFAIGGRDESDAEGDEERIYLFSPQSFTKLQRDWVTTDPYGGRAVGLGWQDLLRPTGTSTNFLPDRRVWTILYSWRVPGFDIDGDGFVGVPNLSSTAQDGPFKVALEETDGTNEGPEFSNQVDTDDSGMDPALQVQVDDYIAIPAGRRSVGDDDLDGRITTDGLCGPAVAMWMPLIFMGLCTIRLRRFSEPRP